MKVVIPILSAAESMSGVQRHAINLVRCLLARPEITGIQLVAGAWQQYLTDICPSDPRLDLRFIAVPNNLLGRNAWYYSALPGICRKQDADIVHLSYPVPFRRSDHSQAVAVTLHDLYPFDLPENFGFPKVLANQAILSHCLKMVDAIACVSASTLRRLDGIEPLLAVRKAVVIQNAVQSSTASPCAPAALADGNPFLLCIAQHRRNKNILLLLEAYVRLLRAGRLATNMKLVIVGVRGPETAAILEFFREHALENTVHLLEGISEGELLWCYQQCSLLVAPSSVEGFGLPVAEALLAGCRIVCSDIPAFREIGDDHCRYISLSRGGIGELMDAIVAKAKQPRPPSVPLPHLSFETIGQQYLSLYDAMLRSPDSSVAQVGRRVSQFKKRDIQV